MKNPITTNGPFRAAALSVFMLIFACVANGQQSDSISKAQVQAILDSIDKACLNRDANAVVANYASNAVITALIVQNGQTSTNKQGRDDYLHALEGSLKNTAAYSLQHKDVIIEIAPDGQTAQCRFTLVERWRGNNGGMEEGLTKESLSLALLDGKLLVTKDHSDVAVEPQTGVPANPSSASAVNSDYSTPVEAANSYFTALQAGDVAVVRSACLGSSEQKEWTIQFMHYCLAVSKLDDVATARFGGDETAKVFIGDLKQAGSTIADALAAFGNCEVKIDGTNATITAKLRGRTPDLLDPALKLQKVADQWKIRLDVNITNSDSNIGMLHAMLDTDMLQATADSVEKCAADIKAGVYKTGAEVQQAMKSAMDSQFIQKQKNAANKPTENPTNQ